MAGLLEGKLALVTGASRGIGRAVALRYAQEGAKLILVARTQGALEEVDDEVQKLGSSATLVPLDLTDFEAIDRMGASIFERFGKLDILVGNAADLGTLTPMSQIKVKEWDRVMALNLTSQWRLLRSMDPLLRQSDAGRAIFVTSTVGHDPRAYWGSYAVSKAGMEMVVKTYAAEQGKTSVKANLINPGKTRTEMRACAYPGEDPETLKAPDDPRLTDLFVKLASDDCTAQGELFDAPV